MLSAQGGGEGLSIAFVVTRKEIITKIGKNIWSSTRFLLRRKQKTRVWRFNSTRYCGMKICCGGLVWFCTLVDFGVGSISIGISIASVSPCISGI